MPGLTEVNEESLLAVKSILDLSKAGIPLYHISDQPKGVWQMVVDPTGRNPFDSDGQFGGSLFYSRLTGFEIIRCLVSKKS